MKKLEESKFQRWRAIAHFNNGSKGLIYLGSSIGQIRLNYSQVLLDPEMFDQKDLANTLTKVFAEQWIGDPDSGRWLRQAALNLPKIKAVA